MLIRPWRRGELERQEEGNEMIKEERLAQRKEEINEHPNGFFTSGEELAKNLGL